MNAPPDSSALGWYPDPSGRHELRFWEGNAWTSQVADAGVLGVDTPADSSGSSTPLLAAASPIGVVPAQPSPAPPQPWPTTQATMAVPPPPGAPAWSPAAPARGERPPPPGFGTSGASAPLATKGQRFGAYLLDGVLAIVTLGIGWLVWCCVTFSRGQTPAKSILGLRVVKQQSGLAATWGQMFLRNVVVQLGLGLLSVVLFGIPTIVAACMIFSGTLNQTGWDRVMGTVVVLDQAGVTVPPGR